MLNNQNIVKTDVGSSSRVRTILDVLKEWGKINPSQISTLSIFKTNKEIENYLISNKLIDPIIINKSYAQLYGLRYINLKDQKFEPKAFNFVKKDIIKQFLLIPYNTYFNPVKKKQIVQIALGGPGLLKESKQGILHNLRKNDSIETELCIVSKDDVDWAIKKYILNEQPTISAHITFKGDVDLKEKVINSKILLRFPEDVSRRYKMVVFEAMGTTVIKVAALNPQDKFVKDILGFISDRSKLEIELFKTDQASIDFGLAQYNKEAENFRKISQSIPNKPEQKNNKLILDESKKKPEAHAMVDLENEPKIILPTKEPVLNSHLVLQNNESLILEKANSNLLSHHDGFNRDEKHPLLVSGAVDHVKKDSVEDNFSSRVHFKQNDDPKNDDHKITEIDKSRNQKSEIEAIEPKKIVENHDLNFNKSDIVDHKDKKENSIVHIGDNNKSFREEFVKNDTRKHEDMVREKDVIQPKHEDVIKKKDIIQSKHENVVEGKDILADKDKISEEAASNVFKPFEKDQQESILSKTLPNKSEIIVAQEKPDVEEKDEDKNSKIFKIEDDQIEKDNEIQSVAIKQEKDELSLAQEREKELGRLQELSGKVDHSQDENLAKLELLTNDEEESRIFNKHLQEDEEHSMQVEEMKKLEEELTLRAETDLTGELEQEIKNEESLKKVIDSATVPKIVAAFINYALYKKASDIHVEPTEKEVRVRFRIDGILYDIISLPRYFRSALVSRIKIMSKLKIDEQRVPQDGRFDVIYGKNKIDVRVSSLPTIFGEKIAMRLLVKSSGVLTLEELGISGINLKRLEDNINKPYGIVLSTGPTGSGKSTTLYAILKRISNPSVNIITLEDPVEYEVPGANQCLVKPKIGFSFAEGLRSVLRQDPNIIMVGEIRDSETANLTVQAAMTGHLVLSTLHTNNAAGSVARLINMKVEPFLITSTVNAVIAQRLVRRICQHCKQEVKLHREVEDKVKTILEDLRGTEHLPDNLEFKFWEGKGCSECHMGYSGRIGLYEIMEMSDGIEKVTIEGRPASEIEDQARKEGMITMFQDGLLKAMRGITTVDEVFRQTKSID